MNLPWWWPRCGTRYAGADGWHQCDLAWAHTWLARGSAHEGPPARHAAGRGGAE